MIKWLIKSFGEHSVATAISVAPVVVIFILVGWYKYGLGLTALSALSILGAVVAIVWWFDVVDSVIDRHRS